jgi:putative transposase
MDGIHFFDPQQDFTVTYKALPHWAQAGAVCFITWRAADSLPAEVIKRLEEERNAALQSMRLDPHGDWKTQSLKLSFRDRGKLQWQFFTAWDAELDCGAGDCALERPELSAIVEQSLLHFDNDRYVLTDFVIMPNHVHVLVAFRDEQSLSKQCTSWKRFTGREIQKALARHGTFWQVEQFDHLVRNAEQFEHYRAYIRENPRKAHLQRTQYCYWSQAM